MTVGTEVMLSIFYSLLSLVSEKHNLLVKVTLIVWILEFIYFKMRLVSKYGVLLWGFVVSFLPRMIFTCSRNANHHVNQCD